MKFKCLLTNETFEVVGTSSTLNDLPHYRDNVIRCKDKVKRVSDGVTRSFDRLELEQRFKNVACL